MRLRPGGSKGLEQGRCVQQQLISSWTCSSECWFLVIPSQTRAYLTSVVVNRLWVNLKTWLRLWRKPTNAEAKKNIIAYLWSRTSRTWWPPIFFILFGLLSYFQFWSLVMAHSCKWGAHVMTNHTSWHRHRHYSRTRLYCLHRSALGWNHGMFSQRGYTPAHTRHTLDVRDY